MQITTIDAHFFIQKICINLEKCLITYIGVDTFDYLLDNKPFRNCLSNHLVS